MDKIVSKMKLKKKSSLIVKRNRKLIGIKTKNNYKLIKFLKKIRKSNNNFKAFKIKVKKI